MSFSLKKILPRTLFGRSLLILVTPVLLIQIITTFMFFDRHWNRMTERLSFAVAGEISVIAEQIERGVDSDRMKEMTGLAAQHLDLLVSYEEGQELNRSEESGISRRSSVAQTLARALDRQLRRPFIVNVDIEEKWVEVSVLLDGGLLRVSLPQRRLFSSSGYIFLLWMIGSSLVLLAIAILFMRNQIRPIRRLAVAAERFGKGQDIPASFKPEGAREIRQAARAFIDMHGRIRRQIEQRTAMLAGVSHDLRTPLTRMKLQAEMLGDGPDVDAFKSDIGDMERMIDGYLDFARGEGEEQVERTNLQAMLEDVISGVKQHGIDADLETEGDLSIQLRPVAFKRCLNNLVNNARKYGGKHIWVSAKRFEDSVEIRVEDDGPGIAEDKMDDVFKPFYRVDESRNPTTGGVGLGLPIAQDIVLSHGGRIWLEKSEKGGLAVAMRIPV